MVEYCASFSKKENEKKNIVLVVYHIFYQRFGINLD